MAMKGLTLNCVDRKKEAYEHVRLGLKKNMMSHVCWHVYGLLYRSDRDYKEAIKCYKQALKRDKDNGQILRDLSLLQIQMRELSGFAETRRQLLTINSKNRNNWIGFAIAHHYQGDLAMALRVLEAYESTLEELKYPDYEHSEMLLYKNQIIQEQGNDQATLSHLEKSEALIVDKLSYREKRGELLIKLGRHSEAEAVYRELLAINSDNHAYHTGFHSALGYAADTTMSESDQEKLHTVYADLQAQYPRSNAVKRIPLVRAFPVPPTHPYFFPESSPLSCPQYVRAVPVPVPVRIAMFVCACGIIKCTLEEVCCCCMAEGSGYELGFGSC